MFAAIPAVLFALITTYYLGLMGPRAAYIQSDRTAQVQVEELLATFDAARRWYAANPTATGAVTAAQYSTFYPAGFNGNGGRVAVTIANNTVQAYTTGPASASSVDLLAKRMHCSELAGVAITVGTQRHLRPVCQGSVTGIISTSIPQGSIAVVGNY